MPEFLDGTKVWDFAFSQPLTAAPGCSAVYSLNQVSRGLADNQRVGREILVKRLWISYYARAHETDNIGPYVRPIIFLDKQFAGTIVPPTLVLQTNDVTSPQNVFNRDRFEILSDETLSMSLTNWSGSINYQHLNSPVKTIVIELNHVISFLGSQGSTIRGNNIAMIMPVVSNTNLTGFWCQSRLFYVDH